MPALRNGALVGMLVVVGTTVGGIPQASASSVLEPNRLLEWGVLDGLTPADAVLPHGAVVTAVAAGGSDGERNWTYQDLPNYYNLALTSGGTVLAWGLNLGGQLGTGSAALDVANPTPVDLPPGTTASAIAAGYDHSLAVTGPPNAPGGIRAGRVLEWGLLEPSQFRSYLPTPLPVALPAGTTVTAVSAGRGFSLALTSDGTVFTWGRIEEGVSDAVYGRPQHPISATATRVPLPAGVTVTAIAAGDSHSLALTSTGAVWAWGDNRCGVLGTDSDGTVPAETKLPAGTVVTAVAAGTNHSLALTSSGAVLAWGCNYEGQLGAGQLPGWQFQSFAPTAVPFPAGTIVAALAAGREHSLAMTSTGEVLGWGTNRAGETGDGSVEFHSSATLYPRPASTGLPVVGIAAGGGQSLAWTAARPATYTGRAAAVYLQGGTLLGGTPLRWQLSEGGRGLCEASQASTTPQGTTMGTGRPACNVGVGELGDATASALTATVLNTTVTTRAELGWRESMSRSNVDSLVLLPGAVGGTDVLDATEMASGSTASCVGTVSGVPTSSSSIGRLTIAGVTVATQPVGGRVMFNPTGRNPTTVSGNPLWVNPTGGRIPTAIVTLNYNSYDRLTNTQVSSPLEVEFPAGGPLSSLIVGRVFVAYTSSGVQGC